MADYDPNRGRDQNQGRATRDARGRSRGNSPNRLQPYSGRGRRQEAPQGGQLQTQGEGPWGAADDTPMGGVQGEEVAAVWGRGWQGQQGGQQAGYRGSYPVAQQGGHQGTEQGRGNRRVTFDPTPSGSVNPNAGPQGNLQAMNAMNQVPAVSRDRVANQAKSCYDLDYKPTPARNAKEEATRTPFIRQLFGLPVAQQGGNHDAKQGLVHDPAILKFEPSKSTDTKAGPQGNRQDTNAASQAPGGDSWKPAPNSQDLWKQGCKTTCEFMVMMVPVSKAPSGPGVSSTRTALDKVTRAAGSTITSGFQEEVGGKRCGCCGAKEHEVVTCLQVDHRGIIDGCPICNSGNHMLEDCATYKALDIMAKLDWLVVKRRNKPTFCTTETWLNLVAENFDKNRDSMPGDMPWSTKFALYFKTEALLDLQQQLDSTGDESLLPTDPATKSWLAAWARFCCGPAPRN